MESSHSQPAPCSGSQERTQPCRVVSVHQHPLLLLTGRSTVSLLPRRMAFKEGACCFCHLSQFHYPSHLPDDPLELVVQVKETTVLYVSEGKTTES